MDEYMTTQEFAAAIRTPVETVRYWRHVGKGPKSFKIGRRVLYNREDVERFITEARSTEHRVAQLPPHDVRLGRTSEVPPIPVEVHPLAEKIAREIEAQAQHEGPRAQRIIKMCASVARQVQP